MSAEHVAMALHLAQHNHAGQVDKAGEPYIGHVLRVGAGAVAEAGEDGLIVGILHDIVEDTPVTLDLLRALGFPAHIVEAVGLVTHDKHEPRVDYLHRLLGNPIAAAVKRADVRDNGSPERMAALWAADPVLYERLAAKYEQARSILGGDIPTLAEV